MLDSPFFRNPRFEDQLANRVVPEGCIIEAAIHSKLGIPNVVIKRVGFFGNSQKTTWVQKLSRMEKSYPKSMMFWKKYSGLKFN